MRTVSFSNPSVSPRTFIIETMTSVARVDTLGCHYKAVSCKIVWLFICVCKRAVGYSIMT